MKCQLLALFGIAVITTSVTNYANADEPADKAKAPTKTIAASTNVLIFRNVRSWNRKPDFEEALAELGFKCFHDRDNSGHGILMEITIAYAAEKKRYAPKK